MQQKRTHAQFFTSHILLPSPLSQMQHSGVHSMTWTGQKVGFP